MPPSPTRFSQLRWVQTVACVVALLFFGITLALGVVSDDASVGHMSIVVGGLGVFLAIIVMTVTPLLIKMEATFSRQLEELRSLETTVAKQASSLDEIVRNTSLSDAAKSLAHRGRELDALREAVREKANADGWEAAIGLIEEVEHRFGFKQEVEALREELDDARNDAIEKRLAEAIQMIEAHFQAYEWELAQGVIDRLTKALPGNARAASLKDRMRVLQSRHKDELKAEWDEAVRRSDTDHAIDVLRTLDQYLSTSEAESLHAQARDVFKEKLLQLGTKFHFAVTDKRWQDALEIGLELIRDFPNARMAVEVRAALDTLRDKARHEQSSLPADATG